MAEPKWLKDFKIKEKARIRAEKATELSANLQNTPEEVARVNAKKQAEHYENMTPQEKLRAKMHGNIHVHDQATHGHHQRLFSRDVNPVEKEKHPGHPPAAKSVSQENKKSASEENKRPRMTITKARR